MHAPRLDKISFAGTLVIGLATATIFAAPPASPTQPALTGFPPLGTTVHLGALR